MTHCCMFLDIEYSRTNNYLINEDQTFKLFLKMLVIFLQKLYGIEEKDICILTLQSSSAKKFSKHIIVRCLRNGEEIMFQDIQDLKIIMNEFWLFLFEIVFKKKELPQLEHMIIENLILRTKNTDSIRDLASVYACSENQDGLGTCEKTCQKGIAQ